MPDDPSPKKPTIEEAFTVIVQLSLTVTTLVSKIDGLIDTVKSLTEVITASNRPSSAKDTSAFPSPPSPVLAHSAYEAAASALRDANMIEEKATRAVIVGLTEATTTHGSLKTDQEIVQGMCEWSDDKEVKKAFAEGTVQFHRHPPSAPPNRRPLKIQFPSKEVRDRFLSGIRRKGGRPPPLKNHTGSYVRRDLTPTELRIEREKKEQIRKLNLASGHITYGLRDTDIITYRNPRALPPNYAVPSAAPRSSSPSADR